MRYVTAAMEMDLPARDTTPAISAVEPVAAACVEAVELRTQMMEAKVHAITAEVQACASRIIATAVLWEARQ